ncbi:hypothetical protein PTKIN_Ptkin11bG0117400 [Pterospermum kingtungense]
MGLGGKLKRKEIDQVNDDFSDFSLSSPATKIRRLDSELPPIIEEDEPFSENQEKAIVLFNPIPNSPHLHTPSAGLSISLSSDLISGFKNQFLQAVDMKSADSDEESNKGMEGCLAVVPWVPSQIPSLEQSRDSELQVPESDEMEVEENARHGYEFGGLVQPSQSQGLHHWPQQHCMVPQPPQNPFTPITWSQ